MVVILVRLIILLKFEINSLGDKLLLFCNRVYVV